MNDSNKIQMEIIKQWKKTRNGWTRIKTGNVMQDMTHGERTAK